MIRSQKNRLASRCRVLRRFFAQAFGLMFRKTLQDEGWVFVLPKRGRWDVTNVFVFQTITVLWLDHERTVLKKRLVAPFTPHVFGAKQSSFLIELPACAYESVSVGDVISWKESKRI